MSEIPCTPGVRSDQRSLVGTAHSATTTAIAGAAAVGLVTDSLPRAPAGAAKRSSPLQMGSRRLLRIAVSRVLHDNLHLHIHFLSCRKRLSKRNASFSPAPCGNSSFGQADATFFTYEWQPLAVIFRLCTCPL